MESNPDPLNDNVWGPVFDEAAKGNQLGKSGSTDQGTGVHELC